MFSCFQGSRGSGHKKAKSGFLVRFWRRLIRPLTHFRHASHSEPKVTQASLSKKVVVSLRAPPRSLPGCVLL